MLYWANSVIYLTQYPVSNSSCLSPGRVSQGCVHQFLELVQGPAGIGLCPLLSVPMWSTHYEPLMPIPILVFTLLAPSIQLLYP